MVELTQPSESQEALNGGQSRGQTPRARPSEDVDALQPATLIVPQRGWQDESRTASERPAKDFQVISTPSLHSATTLVPSTAPNSMFAFPPGLAPKPTRPHSTLPIIEYTPEPAAPASKWRRKGAATPPPANPTPFVPPPEKAGPQTSKPEPKNQPQIAKKSIASYSAKLGQSADPTSIAPPRQQASTRLPPLDPRLEKLKHAQAAQKTALLKYEKKRARSLSPGDRKSVV